MGIHRLSRIEKDLIRHVAAGDELTCSDLDAASLAASGDERHLIRAEVIRDVLLGRHVEIPDPRGLRLVAARITGALDLDRLVAITGLELRKCVVDQSVTMQAAQFPWLTLYGTVLPSLDATGLRVEGYADLRELKVKADSESDGAVEISEAHIGGTINFDDAVLTNKSGPALVAAGLYVGGSMFLRDKFRATANTDSVKTNSAAVILIDAHIVSSLECDGAILTNTSGVALGADGLKVDSGLFLRANFRAMGRGEFAAVRLASAQIGGGLDFRNGKIRNPDGLGLDLRAASVTWLRLPPNVVCRSGREDSESWKGDGQRRLDGLTYSMLATDGADLPQWLLRLRVYTPEYATQPYQQLAATYRAAGDEAAARRVNTRDLRGSGR
jgi:hypothetical protein